jgi:signal transduction histidine kinase
VGKEPFELKKFLFGKINRRITLLFLIVGIVAPTMGIYYFYSISASFLYEESEIFYDQLALLQGAAVLIIALIAIDATIIGIMVSRSISKPIVALHKATQEIEKGNFDIRTDINTNDEIERLGHAINKMTVALSKMDEERRQIDKAKSEFLSITSHELRTPERRQIDKAKSEFLSITSHELRTPITPMKAQLQMLESGYFGKLTNKQKESVEIILRNAERLNRIIEDFLEVSRIEAARLKFVFRKTDLNETIKETINFLEGFAKEKNIELIINTSDLPIIEVDPDRVSQVLRNLTHNAIKFSKNNGKIEVAAVAKKDHILFSINDYGVGMTPEDKLRVFEPFYQIEGHLDRKHGGTGLGLAICRGIVESQKGKLWVESEVDAGSTFYFTVPLKPVDEIEPIKVLFSSKTDMENKIKEEFAEILGPMGLVEFDDLKNKHATGQKDIVEYIDSLQELSILNNANADKFKRNIGKIFGNEPIKEKPDTLYETQGEETLKRWKNET